MKKIIRNGLLVLVAGVLTVSCADYNVTDDFKAQPDPSFVEPYKDLASVKSYINREQYPNLTLGATLNVTEFNKQELAHAAAVTNFDNLAFGTTLMSGAIINEKGVMNFLDMKDLLIEAMGEEMADILWVLICLANQTGVDLTAEFEKSMDKKTRRDSLRHIENEKLLA